MAAGVFSKPGSEYGPCAETCVHIDCASTREEASSSCRICVKEIGYDRRFYSEGNGSGLVHASCLEDEIG